MISRQIAQLEKARNYSFAGAALAALSGGLQGMGVIRDGVFPWPVHIAISIFAAAYGVWFAIQLRRKEQERDRST